MKTAKKWFLTLPEPCRQMAKRYLDNDRRFNKYPSASVALCCSFAWRDTEEGYDFWEGIHDNIYALKNSSK